MNFMTAPSEPATGSALTRWVALAGLLIAESMNLLDATITTVAAPVIQSDLRGSVPDTQWILAAYTLPFAIVLVLGGRLGDIHGRRRMFLVGVMGFLTASAGCAAAPSMLVLIVTRVVQGGFAALIIPQTIGLIKASFTGAALPRALSFIGPVMGLTAVAGPVLGGLLTHADIAGLSWRAVFLVNLPLGVAVLATAPLLREDRAVCRPGLDLPGFAISAAAGSAFVVPTISGSTQSWPAWTWGCFGLGVSALGLLVVHVRRRAAAGRDPIVEPSLFSDGGFAAALVTSVLYFAVSTGIVFVAVLYLQVGLGRTAFSSSLTVLPMAAGLAVASLFAGQFLVIRLGAKLMLVGVGVLCGGLVAGSLTMATASSNAGAAWLAIALGIAGLGGGLLIVPFFTAALSRVLAHEIGSAAGLLNSVQQLGATLGVAVLGTIYLSRASTPARALAMAFALAAGLTVLTAISMTSMLRTADKRE